MSLMTNPAITVRLAMLQDVQAIVSIHTSYVPAWRRWDADQLQVAASYVDLTLFERWQHGGPWLSVETCAVHMHRLLAGSGTPLVAELDGQVLAEAEVYESEEAAPFERCLHLSTLCTHQAHTGRGLGSALLAYIAQMAGLMDCRRVTLSQAASVELPAFYAGRGFRLMHSARRIRFSTHTGRAVFQSAAFTNPDPAQIKGWHMPLGRYQAARQEWEALFPQYWAAGIPELIDVPMAHLKLTVAGQNALVYLRESDDPGVCDLACWSARPLTAPLVTALRDCAARDGFATIQTLVSDADWPFLQTIDAQPTDFRWHTYELPIRAER
ncbi:MAG: GNAT family N-acetyltransferase [Aggregatilineales bacterium]